MHVCTIQARIKREAKQIAAALILEQLLPRLRSQNSATSAEALSRGTSGRTSQSSLPSPSSSVRRASQGAGLGSTSSSIHKATSGAAARSGATSSAVDYEDRGDTLARRGARAASEVVQPITTKRVAWRDDGRSLGAVKGGRGGSLPRRKEADEELPGVDAHLHQYHRQPQQPEPDLMRQQWLLPPEPGYVMPNNHQECREAAWTSPLAESLSGHPNSLGPLFLGMQVSNASPPKPIPPPLLHPASETALGDFLPVSLDLYHPAPVLPSQLPSSLPPQWNIEGHQATDTVPPFVVPGTRGAVGYSGTSRLGNSGIGGRFAGEPRGVLKGAVGKPQGRERPGPNSLARLGLGQTSSLSGRVGGGSSLVGQGSPYDLTGGQLRLISDHAPPLIPPEHPSCFGAGSDGTPSGPVEGLLIRSGATMDTVSVTHDMYGGSQKRRLDNDAAAMINDVDIGGRSDSAAAHPVPIGPPPFPGQARPIQEPAEAGIMEGSSMGDLSPWLMGPGGASRSQIWNLGFEAKNKAVESQLGGVVELGMDFSRQRWQQDGRFPFPASSVKDSFTFPAEGSHARQQAASVDGSTANLQEMHSPHDTSGFLFMQHQRNSDGQRQQQQQQGKDQRLEGSSLVTAHPMTSSGHQQQSNRAHHGSLQDALADVQRLLLGAGIQGGAGDLTSADMDAAWIASGLDDGRGGSDV